MSLHNVVHPSELSAQKAHLEHVPIDSAQPTFGGGVHLGTGHHGVEAQRKHEQLLAEENAGALDSYCAFDKWQVVPDVCDANAAHLAKITFGRSTEVRLGQILTVKETQHRPQIEWAAQGPPMAQGLPCMYTVIVCDPDAPSREDPKWRNFCHMLLVNVPNCFTLDGGMEIAKYMGPAPPPNTGLHRYCFLVYAQKGVVDTTKMKMMTEEKDRPCWSLRDFLVAHQFEIDGKVPIAGNMFRAQNEDQSKRMAEPAAPEQMPLTKRDSEQQEKKESK